MRLTRHKIEQIIGQSPCLCGDVGTWHPACYRGKSDEQINVELEKAYRAAANGIRQQAKNIASKAIERAALTSGEDKK